jgi:hypothetical protein
MISPHIVRRINPLREPAHRFSGHLPAKRRRPMFGQFNRREFLKGSAALVAALSMASWLPTPRRAAGQGSPLPAAPGFVNLPAQLATGAQIADIAAGWDGTLWAVDALGIPHVFDPLQQSWQAFGKGVDAATKLGDTLYLFSGDQVALYDLTTGQVTIQAIAAQWPGLPPSFTRDLDGASAFGGVLLLYRSGRYVNVASPTAVQTLSQVPGWPAATWPDGVIHAAGRVEVNQSSSLEFGVQFRWPPGEAGAPQTNSIGESGGSIINGPLAAVTEFPLYSALQVVLNQRFDAYVQYTDANSVNHALVFQGPIVWTATDSQPMTSTPLSSYVPLWRPPLSHAPRGRVGNLWSVTTAGAVVYHDGEQWNQAPAIPGVTVLGVDVGEDGAPFALATGVGGTALYQFDAATAAWQEPLFLDSIDAQQVAVGDQTRVFVRDSGGNVYKSGSGGFTKVLAGVTHLTANHDGTLWHSDGSANAFRFISERAYPPQALPAASAVQKVASTAYGNALLLTSQGGASQLYTYGSPYVFKTSPSFVPISDGTVGENPQVTAGGGRCFVNLGSGIVALDNHTGAELWSGQLPNQGECKSIVYDRHHRLLYATDSNQTLFALDAATGEERWFFEAASAPISQPALRGGGLCIVGNNVVYWLDTNAALAQGNTQSAAPTWQTTLNTILTDNGVLDPALVQIATDTIYVTLNNNSPTQSNGQEVWSLNSGDGSGAQDLTSGPPAGVLYVPVITNTNWGGVEGLSVFSNRGVSMMVSSINQPGVYGILTLPNNATFAPGLTVYQNTLFAGGSDGNLYGLDLTQDLGNDPPFQPVAQLGPSNQTSFGAGPVTIHTSQGDVIAFSTNNNNVGSIWLYLPPGPTPQPNGALVQLETDHLVATQLTMDANGILYATGSDPVDNAFGQVYAIRVDTLLQQERAFIVESELMQDFDEPAVGQLTATARYQTHVTVVDPNKAPQPFQAIKVWAETGDPNLLALVLIDGSPYYVNDTTPAAVQTDAAGTVTIVSDAGDLSTPALKLWAGFMDPYERIVVYPDREFHNRLATTHYASGSTNPDPTRINLATATTYDVTQLTSPPTLFNQNDQLEQQKAQAAAQVIQQMTASVGYQKGVTPGPARRLRSSADTPPLPFTTKYLAYADLAGAAYGPVNLPANRLVTATAPTGFSIEINADNTITAQPNLAVADAADAIDALNGFLYVFTLDYSFLDTLNGGVITPELQAAFLAQGWPLPPDAAIQTESTNFEWGITTWGGQLAAFRIQNEDNALNVYYPPAPAAQRSLGSWLRHLWDKIKSGVAKVGKLIVSIGKDIYLGLKYIENGIEKILRVVLKDIEDFAIAIGSVFVQLGKDIVKAAEALSVIFHLGQVVNTYNAMKEYLAEINLVATVQGATDAINAQFSTIQYDIAGAFDNLIGQLEGAAATAGMAGRSINAIGTLNGMGNSPRSIFNVGPKNSNQKSSNAVPAMWGIHKLRQNYPNATAPSGRSGAAQRQTDTLAEFLTNFFSDPDNNSQISQAHRGIHTQLNFSSAKEFFASLLGTLLQGLETVALAAVDLVQSLVDGVVGAITADVISGLETIQIPVLSALWKALTGNPLTFLDVLLFVAAIPVTLVYRITEGAYPQAQFAAGVAASATTVLNRVAGLMSSIFGLINGAFSAISDALVIADVTLDGGPKWLMGILGTAAAVGLTIAAGLSIGLEKESWVTFAAALGIASLVMNLSYVPLPAEVPSVVGVLLALLLAVIVWQEYVHTQEQEADKLNLSAGVLGLVPAIVNPIKFLPDDTLAPFVSPIADVVFGQAVAWLTLTATLETWDPSDAPTALPESEEPTPTGTHRVFMPAILRGQ